MIGGGRCASRVLLIAACLLGAAPAAGQWRVELQAGRLRYDAAPEAVTTSLAGGVSYSTMMS